ncbi:hypothetical protein BCR43DRAFT_499398 [Syncephalastrum racemosum]|uniref:Uncharacterized protein n=1 Tax=Syncephalastrum racemosum TaxID=13706 RepID=A0A1X2H095_SYNRA|nr:hypothetical protein BCR43DRAFT_499398 [Syncephalastrum racemosum]
MAAKRQKSEEMLHELFEEINGYLGDQSEAAKHGTELTETVSPGAEIGSVSSVPQSFEPQRPVLIESEESSEEEEEEASLVASPTSYETVVCSQCQESQPATRLLVSSADFVCDTCLAKGYQYRKNSLQQSEQRELRRRSWNAANGRLGQIADLVKHTLSSTPRDIITPEATRSTSSKKPKTRFSRMMLRPKSLPSLAMHYGRSGHEREEDEEEERDQEDGYHRKVMSSQSRLSVLAHQEEERVSPSRQSSRVSLALQEARHSRQSSYEGHLSTPEEHAWPVRQSSRVSLLQEPRHGRHSSYDNRPQSVSQPEPRPQPQPQQYVPPQQSTFQHQRHPRSHAPISPPPQRFVAEEGGFVTYSPNLPPSNLPYLTPAYRTGEAHSALSMRHVREMPEREARVSALNGAYQHCIRAKTDLIPWLKKQYSKGPPDAVFEYAPKPRKTPNRLMAIFKRQKQREPDVNPALQSSISRVLSAQPSTPDLSSSTPLSTASSSSTSRSITSRSDSASPDESIPRKSLRRPQSMTVLPAISNKPLVSILKKPNEPSRKRASVVMPMEEDEVVSYDDNESEDEEEEEAEVPPTRRWFPPHRMLPRARHLAPASRPPPPPAAYDFDEEDDDSMMDTPSPPPPPPPQFQRHMKRMSSFIATPQRWSNRMISPPVAPSARRVASKRYSSASMMDDYYYDAPVLEDAIHAYPSRRSRGRRYV